MSDPQPTWLQNYQPQPGDGRFVPGRSGNPAGRKPGTSKQQKLMKRMLEEGEAVLTGVLDKAKTGDAANAALVLNRILPALRSQSQCVQFSFDPTLPIARQVEAVLAAVASGEVPPDVAQTIVAMISNLANIRATEELEQRIVTLEMKAVT
jgi:Family of unknown function (DUF5681)